MSESKKLRIALWNALHLADEVGGKLSFTFSTTTRILEVLTSEDKERFGITKLASDTYLFHRKP